MVNNEIIILKSIYDSAISFCNKAYYKNKILDKNEQLYGNYAKYLYSYNTLVLTLYNDKNSDSQLYVLNREVNEELLFSRTTLRHIKEFLKQNGIEIKNKKELEMKEYEYILKKEF